MGSWELEELLKEPLCKNEGNAYLGHRTLTRILYLVKQLGLGLSLL